MEAQKRVKIIAEIGVNHNGSFEIAKKMIEVAKECGVDCVKFQIVKPELCISKYAPKANYQVENTGIQESQLEMCKSFELPFDYFAEFKAYCEDLDIEFLATPFDEESVKYLQDMNVDSYKIPSGEITNLPYLEQIARIQKPIYLSTGMCDLDEVRNAIDVLQKNDAEKITILHCTSEYPAPYDEVNLKAMVAMKEEFGLDVGYSDHTKGIEVAIAAVALGATVIEKHFTLDRNMPGPDHIASIEPEEMKDLVQAVRNIEKALGDGKKRSMQGEENVKDVARKSIVAKRKIIEGEIYSAENLITKRPGNGISPMRWYDVIGKRANRTYEEDEPIEL